jgi:hypothetical protein
MNLRPSDLRAIRARDPKRFAAMNPTAGIVTGFLKGAARYRIATSARPDPACKSASVEFLGMRTVNPLNNRQHWRKVHQRAKAQRGAAYTAVFYESRKGIPTLPVVVTLTRIGPRAMDSDNLAASLKPVRDGIADAYGIADNDSRIHFVYGQAKGEYGVKVEIVAGERK